MLREERFQSSCFLQCLGIEKVSHKSSLCLLLKKELKFLVQIVLCMLPLQYRSTKKQIAKALKFTTLAFLLNQYLLYKDAVIPVVLFADMRSKTNRIETLCVMGNQHEYLILQIILRGALAKFYKLNVIVRVFDELHKTHTFI